MFYHRAPDAHVAPFALTIDKARLEGAHALAQRLDRPILLAHTISLDTRHDPTRLYGALYHDPPANLEHIERPAEFFWSSPHATLVAFGHVRDADCASFAHVTTTLQTWRADCYDDETRDALRALGGVAFDPSHTGETLASDHIWSAYRAGRLWVPSLAITSSSRSEEAPRLTLCIEIDPEDVFAEAHDLWRESITRAHGWLESMEAYDVSRETPHTAPQLTITEPMRAQWGEQVAHAAHTMREQRASSDSPLQKVVLARRIEVAFDSPQRPAPILRALHALHPSCATYLIRPPLSRPLPASHKRPPRHIGASPEELITLQEGRFTVDALAGSAPLSTPDEVFLQSEKDLEEHALVIETILEKLRGLAETKQEETRVDELKNIKHLRTRITGTCASSSTLSMLADALHPTPAVCGKPLAAAREYILAHERGAFLDRGWYTGAVGWFALDDRSGELRVSLRSGLLDDRGMTLFVGAGIMPDSDPALEVQETRDKAEAILMAMRTLAPQPDDEVSS